MGTMSSLNLHSRFSIDAATKRILLFCVYALIGIQLLTMSYKMAANPSAFLPSDKSINTSSRQAKRIPAAELMARPLPNTHKGVPKIFHQSWSSLQLPAKFQKWSKTCREKHPDWEYVLWTDEDNLNLIKMHLPWLVDTYENLKGPIYRADLIRNAYMFLFGG
jgi:mannosyltransferase OCH1-like enzyme